MGGFPQPQNDERGNGGGSDHIIDRRNRRTGLSDQPRGDERRKATEDGNCGTIADRQAGGARPAVKEFGYRSRARPEIERGRKPDEQLGHHGQADRGLLKHQSEERKGQRYKRETGGEEKRLSSDMV